MVAIIVTNEKLTEFQTNFHHCHPLANSLRTTKMQCSTKSHRCTTAIHVPEIDDGQTPSSSYLSGINREE